MVAALAPGHGRSDPKVRMPGGGDPVLERSSDRDRHYAMRG